MFDKETNKPIVSLIHSTGKSDTALIPTLKCLIVPNRDNMDKPKIIINSHSKEEQFKLILDTGSNVSLINKRLISKEMKNHVHKTKAKINFPLLDVKEEFVEQINIQVNNEIHTFFIIELDIIDVLFGNDILKDSIINQKNKLIKLNNSTYKINYQQSNQLHCNVKAPRKHVTVSNDNHIPSQLCDILAKTNPEEEEIQVLRGFINDLFEDLIVDKLPDIPDQINNSRRDIHSVWSTTIASLIKSICSKMSTKECYFCDQIVELFEFHRHSLKCIIKASHKYSVDIETVINETLIEVNVDYKLLKQRINKKQKSDHLLKIDKDKDIWIID
ncbi:hypothetical protein ACTFIY_011756 [Dictyostelium cf. discoideum]